MDDNANPIAISSRESNNEANRLEGEMAGRGEGRGGGRRRFEQTERRSCATMYTRRREYVWNKWRTGWL